MSFLLLCDFSSVTADGVEKVGRELLADQFTSLRFLPLVQHSPRPVFRQLAGVGLAFTGAAFDHVLLGRLIPRSVLPTAILLLFLRVAKVWLRIGA